MASEFELVVRERGGAVVIEARGELDLASTPSFEAELDRAWSSEASRVVVDLRKLEFMDSTGLSAIVRAHQRAQDLGRSLYLVKGPQQVQRLLTLTGVAERLLLIDTPEDAPHGS